jgi:hypothetical protein
MSDATERNTTALPGSPEGEREARREFLRRVGRAGVTVPAVSLLLAANFTRSSAEVQTGSGGSGSGSSVG